MNEVFWIRSLLSYSQHFIFFVTYDWDHLARELHYTKLKRIARDKHFSLLNPFLAYK
jgi:hypothetical protein